jgi:lysyl-tRNA synthetase class 2
MTRLSGMGDVWSPSASIQTLTQRANTVMKIRQFFAERGVLEVETPLLSHATVTDPHVIGIPATFKEIGSNKEKTVYLQTSPEYAMKRLLAAGSGAIYQITKAFRQGEIGRCHNPEFSMLEWYRPGFDHHALMDEMDALLQMVLNGGPAQRLSYAAVFEKWVGINPHLATLDELIESAKKHAISISDSADDRNFWLDLLLTHCVEPHLGMESPLFLYDFPITQAALAKIRDENPPVASRFEVYFKGVELANGFHELQDAKEQRRRFEADLMYRQEAGISHVPIDENFLAALEHGFPDCAGVALGIDRLVMLACKENSVGKVISFDFERA